MDICIIGDPRYNVAVIFFSFFMSISKRDRKRKTQNIYTNKRTHIKQSIYQLGAVHRKLGDRSLSYLRHYIYIKNLITAEKKVGESSNFYVAPTQP